MQVALQQSHLYDFHKDYFIVWDSSSRLRVFDTNSQKCLVCLSSGSGKKNQQIIKKEAKTCICTTADPTEGDLILLGSSTGIEAVDLATGELRWSGVSTVVPAQYGVYYCSETDRTGGRVNLEDGSVIENFKIGKHKAKRFLILEETKKMAVGGSHLLLWDAVKNKSLIKYSGHEADVCALAVSPDGKYIFSAASEEKHVSIWTTENKRRNALGSVWTGNPVAALEVSAILSSQALALLVVTQTGVASIYRIDIGNDYNVDTRHWAKIQTPSLDTMSSNTVIAARLEMHKGGFKALVVHGNAAFPIFSKIDVGQMQETVIVIELEEAAADLLTKSEGSKTKKRTRDISVVGPDNSGVPIQSAISKAPKRHPSKSELSLGEMVSSIEARMHKSGVEKDIGSLNASSAAVLVRQINQSGDLELFNRAMRLPESIVTSTARQLSSKDAGQFFRFLAERLRVNPKDSYSVVSWIKSISKFHAAFLMASPDLHRCISSVKQIVEARMRLFDGLVALNGKIEMILAQADQKNVVSEVMIDDDIPEVTIDLPMSEDEIIEYDADRDGVVDED